MDARLVPAALVAWLSGFVAVVLPVRLTLGVAAVLAALSIVPVASLCRERRRAHSGRPTVWPRRWFRRRPHSVRSGFRANSVRGRHRAGRSDPPAAAVLLTILCAVAVLAATAGHVHARSSGLLPELVDQRATAVVRGTVLAEPRPVLNGPVWQAGPRYRVLLSVQEVSGRGKRAVAEAPVVLVGPAAWADVALGQEIEVRGRFAPTAPGDAASAVVFSDRAPRTTADPQGHLAVVHALRSSLRDVTAGMSPQAQGLVPGIAVGDDRALPEDLRDAMRATSLTHLTAVSGAHVAILLGCTLLVLVWLPRWARTVLGALVLTAFVTLVRPEPSVLRSAVMGAVVLAALALGRPARALPALCAAVVVLVLADPWLARSYGFVLSVLATAGLVVLARPWTRWLSHVLPRWAAALVAVPAAAQALCGPVVVLLTPAVATYAVPANVLAAPAVPPATVLGVAATLVAPWSPAAAGLLAGIAGVCTWWIAGVARFFAGLPAAQLPWPGGVTGMLALAGATALGVLVLHRARQPTQGVPSRGLWWVPLPVLLVLLLAFLPGPVRLVGAWLPGGWPPRDWLAAQCDVGQGSATVLRSGPEGAVMTDVGPVDGGAAACLSSLGVERLDLLVLTHAHADHVGGLPEVLDEVTVTRVLLTPGSRPAATTRAVLEELAAADVPVDR
ncbi:ComEC/Rec2 family competence protein, partial [Georgenia sp. 10Sc9-8]|nr:ComEC/Rec2 family competence protein [Georgenia halotolerans]